MPESKVSQEEIEALQKKLETSKLSSDEKTLLENIFSAARDWIRQEEESAEAESMLTQLRKQLARSFLPGDTSGFGICFYKITPPPPKITPRLKITPRTSYPPKS